MQIANAVMKILGWFSLPIRLNATFFFFMYVLGIVCAYLTLPTTKDAHVYDNLYLELFLDLYVICTLLAILPKTIRKWVRRLFYVILYVVAIIDVYCFVKFDSTLTPTMLLLVGETNANETKEFFQTHLTSDILWGPVGWILLIMIINIIFCLIIKKLKKLINPTNPIFSILTKYLPTFIGLCSIILLIWSSITSAHNKQATWTLMTGINI